MNNTTIPFWKTLAFWISLCTWTIAVSGHYVGEIPAPYGLIAANVIAAIYATLRCLVKRREGLSWKGILGTSEFTVTSVTVLVNLVNALAQVPDMPPKVLVLLSAAGGFLATVLHHLSGSNGYESKISNADLADLVDQLQMKDPIASLHPAGDGSATQGSATQGSGAPSLPASEAITTPLLTNLHPTKKG